jgi:hypothetical protein
MKLDPGLHIGMHLIFFGKAGVKFAIDLVPTQIISVLAGA